MSIARAIGGTGGSHIGRDERPHVTKILASPDENLVGCLRDDKYRPRRRARPRHQWQQRRQVYHRFDPPGHRATRNRRRAGVAIAYSLLLDGGHGAVRDPRFLLSRNLPSTCAPAIAPWSGSGRAIRMQHNAAYGWPRCPGSLAPHMQQDAACPARGERRERCMKTGRDCARARGSRRWSVRRYTHGDRSQGTRSGFVCVLGPITP